MLRGVARRALSAALRGGAGAEAQRSFSVVVNVVRVSRPSFAFYCGKARDFGAASAAPSLARQQ